MILTKLEIPKHIVRFLQPSGFSDPISVGKAQLLMPLLLIPKKTILIIHTP